MTMLTPSYSRLRAAADAKVEEVLQARRALFLTLDVWAECHAPWVEREVRLAVAEVKRLELEAA